MDEKRSVNFTIIPDDDNKVARVSDRLTGMKFVIPVHLRK